MGCFKELSIECETESKNESEIEAFVETPAKLYIVEEVLAEARSSRPKMTAADFKYFEGFLRKKVSFLKVVSGWYGSVSFSDADGKLSTINHSK